LVAGTCGGTLSGNTFTTDPITADCTVIAMFSQLQEKTYTITAIGGAHGTISPSGAVSVVGGMSQTFTVTPDPGYSVILDWTGNTSCSTMSSHTTTTHTTYITLPITADCTIAPTYVQGSTYNVTVSAGPGGTLSWSGSTTISPPGGGWRSTLHLIRGICSLRSPPPAPTTT
jgi:hypothetical protein